jgi:hypothetical protein
LECLQPSEFAHGITQLLHLLREQLYIIVAKRPARCGCHPEEARANRKIAAKALTAGSE